MWRRCLAVMAVLVLSGMAGELRAADMRRIGVLMGIAENDPEAKARGDALRLGLEGLGWKEGRDIVYDFRYSAGDSARARVQASQLVGLRPAILIASATSATAALQAATTSIPIVFAQVVDPIGAGFVSNLARPGGNITGFTSFDYGMGGKWREALKDVVPRLGRLAVVVDPATSAGQGHLRDIEQHAAQWGIAVTAIEAAEPAGIERDIAAFGKRPAGGIIVLPGPANASHREAIVRAANASKLPAVYPYRYYVASGGLMSYGIDTIEPYRTGVAKYVDAILRGQKAGELPVQSAIRYEIVVNAKTAKRIGISIPQALLMRADVLD